MDSVINTELMITSLVVLNIRFAYAIQDMESQSLICSGGHVLIEATNKCFLGKRVTEICNYSEQCRYYDSNAYCDDNWICNIRCQSGQEFHADIGRCIKKLNLNETIKAKIRDLAQSLKSRNISAINNLFLTSGGKQINLFSLMQKSSTPRPGACLTRNQWNNSTQVCKTSSLMIYSGSLLFTFMFSVVCISLILLFYRRRPRPEEYFFQSLHSLSLTNSRPVIPNVYFMSVPSHDSALPSYQECVITYGSKLPSYEEAVGSDAQQND